MSEPALSAESSFLDGGWTMVCTCGWKGATRATQKEAVTEGQEHAASSHAPPPPFVVGRGT